VEAPINRPDAQFVDAQPFLRPDPNSVWRRSNEARDAIYDSLAGICRELEFDVLINRSPDFVYPNWVSLHAWLPTETPGITRRIGLVVELHLVPHHRFEITYLLKIFRNNKERVFKFLVSLDPKFQRDWILHLLQDKRKPSWRHLKIREKVWALWMPNNYFKSIRTFRDPVASIGWILFLITGVFFALSVGGRNPVGDQVGLFMYRFGLMSQTTTYDELPTIFLEYALGFCVPAVALLVLAARRKVYHMNSGRPEGQPRRLRTADSWSGLLPGIGRQQGEARQRFITALRSSAGEKREIRMETISYVTPTGKREREQIVLTEGRAILFCHIYAYEEDLLIGWDAHLNIGEWTEKKLAQGIHRALRTKVVVNTVVPGTVTPNEYDLIDLNGLTDWAHSNLVRIVKQLIAEHKLDEEIDLTIVRGERQSLLGQPEDSARRKSRFRRAS
jgi:hypothetical protein